MHFPIPDRLDARIQHLTGRAWVLPEIASWLKAPAPRHFLLTGAPGTGKSMILAWLGGHGPAPADARPAEELAQLRGLVRAVHFCQASSRSNSPSAFAESVARQLTATTPGFDQALLETVGRQVTLAKVEQKIGTVAAGGNVTGIMIERLDLGGDEEAFDRAFSQPLCRLYRSGFNESLLILVDSLDEANTYTGEKLPRLLAGLDDLPPQVRILASSRPDPDVFRYFPGVTPLDLITKPDGSMREYTMEIQRFAENRLAELAPQVGPSDRGEMAVRVAQAADGIFLYAALLLEDLGPRLTNPKELPDVELPRGLSGLYHAFLSRKLGKDLERWRTLYRPLLGCVAVARSALESRQLSEITGLRKQAVSDALADCRQYLVGDPARGGIRLFHKSFADYLVDDSTNTSYGVDPAEMHQMFGASYLRLFAQDWEKIDTYGLRWLPTHLYLAGDAELLNRVVLDTAFQEKHFQVFKDLAGLTADLRLAVEAAARETRPAAVALTVEAALGYADFRRKRLRPEVLFERVHAGDLDAAQKLLAVFNVDLIWREIALLAMAWEIAERKPSAARALSGQPFMMQAPTVRLLRDRVAAKLEGRGCPLPPLPPSPSHDQVENIMGTLGANGEGGARAVGNVETVQSGASEYVQTMVSERVGAAGFVAERYGPALVAFASASPEQGKPYFEQYVVNHAANHYAHYRNLSLLFLLDAVLRHPDDDWVRQQVSRIVLGALAGEGLHFDQGLRWAALALAALEGDAPANEQLDRASELVVSRARRLAAENKFGDPWAFTKRELSAILLADYLRGAPEARLREGLELAAAIPRGFAGFQAPACLAVAETWRLVLPGSPAKCLDWVEAAVTAAHNIQDPVFCANMTARANAMMQIWSMPQAALLEKAQALARSPSGEAGAALHVTGETYLRRQPGSIQIPPEVSSAQTLEELAEIYQESLGEFLRLNREKGWSAGTILRTAEEGGPDLVLVPDREFWPMVAARCAVECCASESMPLTDRIRLVQSLVPVAAENATELDRLLVALVRLARPKGPELQRIRASVERFTQKDLPAVVHTPLDHKRYGVM